MIPILFLPASLLGAADCNFPCHPSAAAVDPAVAEVIAADGVPWVPNGAVVCAVVGIPAVACFPDVAGSRAAAVGVSNIVGVPAGIPSDPRRC